MSLPSNPFHILAFSLTLFPAKWGGAGEGGGRGPTCALKASFLSPALLDLITQLLGSHFGQLMGNFMMASGCFGPRRQGLAVALC